MRVRAVSMPVRFVRVPIEVMGAAVLFGGVFRRARSGRELRGRTRRRMPPRGRMGARARARRLISDAVSSKPEEGSRRSRIIDRCL